MNTTKTRFSINYLYTSLFVLIFFSSCVAQQWEYIGSSNNVVLQNKLNDPYGNPVKNVVINANGNTRVKFDKDGFIRFQPRSGGIIFNPTGQVADAGIKIRSGNYSGLASLAFHTHDWGQNIQSETRRMNTVSYVVRYNGIDRFYVNGNGMAISRTGFWTTSDSVFKERIESIKSPLEKIEALNGVEYYLKQETLCEECDSTIIVQIDTSRYMGLILQEVEKIVPEVVRTVNNGDKVLSYQNLVALLIEGIKEQQQIIQDHKKDIEFLKNEIEKLKQKKK